MYSKLIISLHKQVFFTNWFDQIGINAGTGRVLSLSQACPQPPSLFYKQWRDHWCCVWKRWPNIYFAWKTHRKIFLFWGQQKRTMYFQRHILKKSWTVTAENFQNKLAWGEYPSGRLPDDWLKLGKGTEIYILQEKVKLVKKFYLLYQQ